MNKLRKIAPRLSKIKKENPFRVPDNYFDDFSARLAVKLEAEKEVLPQPKNPIIRYLKPVLGLAASFALIFMLVYWPLKSFLPQYFAKSETYIESTNEDDTFISILERLDETLFFALLTEPTSENETEEAGFNDDELLGYLSANISDYELYLQTEN
jgi:hypothetical protein